MMIVVDTRPSASGRLDSAAATPVGATNASALGSMAVLRAGFASAALADCGAASASVAIELSDVVLARMKDRAFLGARSRYGHLAGRLVESVMLDQPL